MTTTAHETNSKRPLLAPLRHTIILVAVFVVMGAAGLIFQKQGPDVPTAHPNVVPLYLSLIAAEWGMVYFVWRGLRRNGTRLRDIVGTRWSNARTVVIDIVLGIALSMAWIGGGALWEHAFGADHAKSIDALLPQGPIEIPLWIAVSLSAGFCEETVFRGYLQKQFIALTGSGVLAILLQAAVFGAAHAYQGLNATANIAAYGVLLGALALWRKNLFASIVSHAWTDIFAGLLARLI